MSDDDSYSDPDDGDRTVIKPVPGGRRRAPTAPAPPPAAPAAPPPAAPPAAQPPPPPHYVPQQAPSPTGPQPPLQPLSQPLTAPALGETAAPGLVGFGGENPLLDAAGTIFALVKRLRGTPHYGDVAQLHASVVQTVRSFESDLVSQGIAHGTVIAARYALCTLLDETVLSTPWGSDSPWSKQSLLSTLHNETWGGEKFFQILQQASQDAARNIDLLELLYVCLALGFKGKYGVMDQGGAQLADVQQMLYRTIVNQRGEYERELSPRWRGIADPRPAVARFVPLWVVPIVVCALLVLAYLGFGYALNRGSDAAFARLNELGREIPMMAARPEVPEIIIEPAPEIARSDPLYGFLEEEVRRGLVDLEDRGSRIRIVVHNNGLFGSGQATVADNYRPLLAKIAAALDARPGPFVVAGHTDSEPIRTLRFPSNWHLSQARADSVKAALAAGLSQPDKVQAEGRGESAPIAGNDTSEGRRRNRRIEIDVPKL